MFMVTRENLTKAGGGGLPLVTEREKLKPLWAALPQNKKTPSKIIVTQVHLWQYVTVQLGFCY